MSCHGWHGISLLDVMGKVFVKIVQQHFVEEEVADSQYGFRCNRGCIDMIFVHVNWLNNTILEHFSCLYISKMYTILYPSRQCG